jgi:hypothetical protein
MAAGQPSRTGGRCDALESLSDFRPELAVAAQDICKCKPGFVPSKILQVDAQDAVPRRAGSVGLVPGYPVNAPRAVRKAASAHACPAGTPQHRAAAKPLVGQAAVSQCARRQSGC